MPFLLLMPSYNQARYVEAAVESALAQDDPDWELWIVDNSSDDTPQRLQAFGDPRIRFHHIPQRMDPGACLNWMLERAQGREFSYVHTDNLLYPGYVRRLRAALSDELSLAYCDMRLIDDAGRRTGVGRRGEFDLARLLSLGPLGVPFAATTALARKVGGFATRDVADDVRFCTLAWPHARFTYVREVLLDYRLHEASRTQDAGGDEKLRRILLHTHLKVAPLLAAQGVDAAGALAQAIRARLDDAELRVEDVWLRKLSRRSRWQPPRPDLGAFVEAGLLSLPGVPGPALRWLARPAAAVRFALVQPELRKLGQALRDVLVPWACLRLGESGAQALRIRSLDARTLWGASILRRELGWTARVDRDSIPGWLPWPRAQGGEPLLDLSGAPALDPA